MKPKEIKKIQKVSCYSCGMIDGFNMDKFAIKCRSCGCAIEVDYIHQKPLDKTTKHRQFIKSTKE